MNYSAVIFDLDGTILDNEEIYDAAFCSVLEKYGVPQKSLAGNHNHIPGIGLSANWKKLKEQYKIKAEIQTLVHETQDAYHARISPNLVRPGFYELHQALREEQILTALTTSNDWWLVEDELQDIGLDTFFDTTVTADEVINNKPAPDLFLVTARKLQVEPEECIVIEDSEAGIKAAKTAGMFTIAIDGINSTEDGKRTADAEISSFETLTPDKLNALFLE